jgi:putative spermidine/putrescine transport system ATP-binding protein
MSDRVAILHEGRIMQFDTPRAIYERPASRFVAQFIGESCFLPVEVAQGVASHAGRKLALPAAPLRSGRHLLLLRPERLSILGEGEGLASGEAGPGVNRFPGRVAQLVFQGESVLLSVDLEGGGQIQARIPNRRLANGALPAEADSVVLGLHAEDAIFLPEEVP